MPAPLLAVLAVNFILQIAVSAARPLTSVRALALGADGFQLGLLAAAYAALALVIAVPIGRLIDRYGRSVFIVTGCLFVSSMLAATAFTHSTVLLIVIQSGIGLALINANLGMQSTIAAASAPETSATAFGRYSTGTGVGQLTGPALAGLLIGVAGTQAAGAGALDPNETNSAFLAFAGIAGIATIVAFVLPASVTRIAAATSEPTTDPPSQASMYRLVLRHPGVIPVLAASAMFVASSDLLAIYMPAYGVARGYSIVYIGALLSMAAAGSIGARLMTGAAIRMLGRPTLMLVSSAHARGGFGHSADLACRGAAAEHDFHWHRPRLWTAAHDVVDCIVGKSRSDRCNSRRSREW